MKKFFIAFSAVVFFVIGFRIFFQEPEHLQTAYLYHYARDQWDKSYYWGKLCYDPIKKKAWVDGGFGINYFDNQYIAKLVNVGIPENVAEQKEYFNNSLDKIRDSWSFKKKYSKYNISDEDKDVKTIRAGDDEFFNSLRYYLIKKNKLTEIDEAYVKEYFKTWFHSLYYFLKKDPNDDAIGTYYSSVFPHHKISEEENWITIEIIDG